MFRRLVLLSAVALLGSVGVVAVSGAQPAGDEEPPEVVREAIEVPLRSIRVLVTDGSGDPVPGLGRGDFRLLHDGERLEVEGV